MSKLKTFTDLLDSKYYSYEVDGGCVTITHNYCVYRLNFEELGDVDLSILIKPVVSKLFNKDGGLFGSVFSYHAGGFTGKGSCSGGSLAIFHPDETVINPNNTPEKTDE